ncbi:16S rRNA (cytosine(1402)-N(4))-methyltransferase RsmH [Flavobacteriales bacterium]|nr:16S rRNA (cytosine(1402)-N(4))-methyltransferase RsmH [Flavobacteriales bacterium]
MGYHSPVLLSECIEGLNIKPTGIYVDVTFGGGGHSKEIMKHLDPGKLFAFDQDADAYENNLQQDGFKLIDANFRYLRNFLRMEGVKKVDGILADLGVSSHQFDIAERGFSTRFEGELDMRMNLNSDLSAKEVVNNYSQENLANVLYKYGELKNSRRIAKELINARSISEINTTKDLIKVIAEIVPEKHRNQFLARVFQAIRIEVNDEITALEEMLLSAVDILNPGGRLVVISYHSLEDRLVKNLMKKGNLAGKMVKDFYGNPIKDLIEINRKVIVASSEEIADNSRARSAKLRVAEKINEN